MFQTPLLLITFNRPNETLKTLQAIKKIKPKKIYFFSDGPRKNRLDDIKLITETRALVKTINWECEVKTNFQTKNLGCGPGPVTAINWLFSKEESGIILEDDCIAAKDFFIFCQQLLDYYKDENKVMHISGNNFQSNSRKNIPFWFYAFPLFYNFISFFVKVPPTSSKLDFSHNHKKTYSSYSYYFSQYTHNWGWATWKRAWKHFDFSIIGTEKKKHMWDMQWLLSVQKQKGLAILPTVNLVQNIGFSESASHTRELSSQYSVAIDKLSFPLIHPSKISRDWIADLYTYFYYFHGTTIGLIKQILVAIIPESFKAFIKAKV